MEIHVVKQGESVSSIAAMYGVEINSLIYDNQIYQPDRLVVGQALLILNGEPAFQLPLRVKGYAYTFIDRNILQESLPYINDILIFSYGFTPEGELLPPIVSDESLIEQAVLYGVAPVLVLTPSDGQDVFNSNLVTAVATDQGVRDTLINNLLTIVESKGYTGVDVDFEYVLAEDRVGYAEFVGQLREVMNANGYTVSVPIVPKTYAEQPGLLYAGIDYRLLGQNADSVFLMTYEWGYT